MGRNNILNANKISDGQSLAADFETDPVMIETSNNVGIWIEVPTGITDNTGEFTVQVRAYKDANNASAWADLTTTYTLANAAATFFRKEISLPACQIRVAFVAAGGTPDGSCDIWISATGS